MNKNNLRYYQCFGKYVGILIIAVCFLQAHSQDNKENSEFKLAVSLYNDGMYDLALQQFKNFISAYPNTSQGIEARFYFGLTQMKLKQYDDARITFQNFALTYVDHSKAPEAWMKVGDAFLALENEREAASAYERVKVFHAKSPLASDALLKAAQLYRHIGDRESAKKALRTIVQDYPTSKSVLPARLAIGDLYAEEGQTELAEQEARRVTESDVPAAVKASALFAIGRLKTSESLFDAAEATFKTITSTYKGTPAAYSATFELGKLVMSAREYSIALEQFKKVFSENAVDDSLQAKALFEAGSAYVALHDYTNARKSYERLASKFSKSPLNNTAMLEAARNAFLSGDSKESLQMLKKIISLPPSSFHRKALILAAQTATSAKNYGEASKYYSAYLENYPDDASTPEVILDLGKLYEERLQDFRKALMMYDQIGQKFPQSSYVVDALMAIGRCQEKLGDNEGTLKTLEDLQNQYPANDENNYVQEHIAFLQHHRIKNRDSGMEKLALLVGEVLTQKSKAELSFQLGEIYFNDLKDYPAAAKQFSAAIDNGLDEKQFINAYYYRARAYHLQSEIDSAAADQAILYYDAFLKQFSSSKWSEDAAYYSFLLKSQKKNPNDILLLGEDFLKQHPASSYREKVLHSLGMSSMILAQYAEAKRYFGIILQEFPTSPLTSSALLQCGTAYLQLNQPDSAVGSWKNAASLLPLDHSAAIAIWKLTEVYQHNKNYSEALTLLKRISTELFYTSFAEKAATILPDAYLANGDFDEAITFYENRLQHVQSSPFQVTTDRELLFNLANAYDKKGDRQRTIQFYNRYLLADRKGTNASRAFYALGVYMRSQGKTSEASAYFKQAAALGGEGTAASDVADLLFQTEQYTEAAKQYRQLAQSADSITDRRKYWAKVIVSTLRLDKLAEAQNLITEFEQTYGKDKQYRSEFEYEKGSHYYRKQDYTNAKKVFEKLADDDAGTRFGPWGHYYLGKIFEVNNKLEEAAKKYESILKKFPDSDVVPRVLLSLGNMHFNVERYEDAIRYYQHITEAPDAAGDVLPYAMNNLIEAYESTKLYDAALKTTKDFIERYPNDESILDKKIKIGTLYTKIGYYDQAILHFQNLLNEAGSLLEAEIHYDIGEAYYYKGEYQQAILEFLKVPYLVSKQGKVNWTATSFYMAGQSYEKMTKYDEAIGMYQQVIDRPGIDVTFKAAAKKEIDRVKSFIKKDSK